MAKARSFHGEIDWASAEVQGGDLTVPLAGGPSKDWAARLAHFAQRLDRTGHGWGDVKVSRKRLRVSSVQEGRRMTCGSSSKALSPRPTPSSPPTPASQPGLRRRPTTR